MKASQLATKVIHDIYKQTGITATCGVGTNLYLAKIAKKINLNKLIYLLIAPYSALTGYEGQVY